MKWSGAWLRLLGFAFLALAGCSGDPGGPSTGSLAVTVSGLPAGAEASITVTGPGGFNRTVSGTETLSALAPGSYTVAAATVTVQGAGYAPTPASQTVIVGRSDAPAGASVAYARASGGLEVTISGLPPGTDADVQVTGPGGFNRHLTASATLTGLTPGSYTVAASTVSAGPSTYHPSPENQSANVTASSSPAAATVTYNLVVAGAFNLSIDGMYLTQSVQSYTGGVPLVQDRDGYLRVFVVANQANTARPAVRVRLYLGGVAPVATYVIPAPGLSVPTGVDESSLAKSWNVALPHEVIQPNLSILADVDPDGTVDEGNETDNAFPATGVPQVMDVRTASTFRVRFVPVRQSVNNREGNVTSDNKDEFLVYSRKMHPLSTYDATTRPAYTTSVPAVTADNGNESWHKILQEVSALRTADSDADGRYYYGVVKTSYSSGIAGIGYVGGRTAVGWDFLPSGSSVAAHEWGHNWGRNHAPCGGVSDSDPSYPYGGGTIGVYGLDVATATLKPPSSTDLMGYCGSQWISDYTYKGVLSYRASGAGVASAGTGTAPGTGAASGAGAAPGAVQPTLLVWGRIVNGEPVLEPAFQVTTRPVLPQRPGPYSLEGRADDGSVLFAISFAAEEVADLPGGGEHFAFTVPLSASASARLSALRLSARGRITTSTAATPPPVRFRIGGVADSVAARRAEPGRVALRWDTIAHPMVMVRDPATGQVLSFARGGETSVWTERSDLELVLSNRVRSITKRARVTR